MNTLPQQNQIGREGLPGMTPGSMAGPLSPYNPLAMAQMMQMQNMNQQETAQYNPEKFKEITQQDILNKRLEFATNISAQQLVNTDSPQFILAYGPVRSGKSILLRQISNTIESHGGTTKTFYAEIESDNQEDISKHHMDKEFLSGTAIKHISDLYETLEDFRNGTIFIDGLDQLGKKDEIAGFISFAKRNNINIVANSPNNKFDGSLVEQLMGFVDLSDLVFEFDSLDAMDPNSIANSNYLGVAIEIDAKGKHRVLDTQEETYYSSMTPIELDIIIKKFKNLPNNEGLMIHRPAGHEEVKTAILLPAHPTDTLHIGDSSRQLTLSATNYSKLYSLANIPPKERMHITSEKIVNWAEIGL